MRVAISGASGLIGSALARALRERGDDVVVFVRPESARQAGDLAIRWNPAIGDVDQSDLRRIGGVDAIVNLSGTGIGDKRWNTSVKSDILDSRLRATRLLSEASRSLTDPPSQFVSGSAIGIYGSRGDEELLESSSPGEGFLADVCRQWESAAVEARQHGATVSLLRTAIVLTRRGGALSRQLPLFRWGGGGLLGPGTQWMSPVSLRDEVAAITFILDQRIEGPINVACPQPVTNREFTTTLGDALHRPTFAHAPSAALRLALGTEMANELLLVSQRVRPGVLESAGFEFRDPTLASIVQHVVSDEGAI